MKPARTLTTLFAVALLVAAPCALEATNGYFSHGYGTQYKGMAGAGVALPLSTLAPATNPAGMVFLGKRIDVGVALFSPNRQYSVSGAPSGFPGTFGLAPGTFESGSTLFAIPSFGGNWMLNDNSSFGVALYGNGGMNTDYASPTFGFAPTGVDLSQMFIAPTYAFRFAGAHAIGITGIVSYQRFRSQGLAAFSPFSSNPAALTDNGYANSFGYGARIGYLGEWSDYFSFGASYQTKIKMSELDNYAGLFAEHGGFDIPDTFTVGVAVKPSGRLDLLFDYQRVNYAGITSIAAPILPNLMQSQLGMDDGAGFGWQDVNVYKLGLQFRSDANWTWRGGYSHGGQPIPSSEMLFNILAPGIIEQHATFGLSRALGGSKAIHFSLTRAFSKSIEGPNRLEVPDTQMIELRMNQWDFDVSFTFGF
jgi:long-chain fatty acid transport protein